MGDEGLYPPLCLALLQEKARVGGHLSSEEKEALTLPYPELPQAIRDFKFRMPQTFNDKFVNGFSLRKIANYREMFLLSKLLDEGVGKRTLSGFGNTPEEQAFVSSRRSYKTANVLSYAATFAAVAGFNVVYTLPLWFRTFGIGWVLLGNFSVLYGVQGLMYPIVDYFKRGMITSGAQCLPGRKAELLKLKESGVLTSEVSYLPAFPPNPFQQQLEEEAKKLKVWQAARAKKGTIEEDIVGENIRYPDTRSAGDWMVVTIDRRLRKAT